MDSYSTQKQLDKSYLEYIPIDKQRQPPVEKSCHCLENNILIFIDQKLVERFGIEDGTQFEQIAIHDGILLKKVVVNGGT